MAKRKVDKNIKDTIDKYISKISEHYKIDAVYLFGSFARGSQHEYSDIDIAVVSNDITDEMDDMAKMMTLSWGIDTRIEPHPIKTEDFYKKETMFVNEVIRTGILLYLV